MRQRDNLMVLTVIVLGGCGQILIPDLDAYHLRTDEANAGEGGASSSGGGTAGNGGIGGMGNGGGGNTEIGGSAGAGAQVSSGTSASTVSSSSSSSSSGTTEVIVFCASIACAPSEVCCYNLQDPNLDHCNVDANCGMGYAVLTCNGPSDCPGGYCCITRANGSYTGSSCQPMCAGPPGDYIACEGDQSVCPAGLTCQQSMALGTGYLLCR